MDRATQPELTLAKIEAAINPLLFIGCRIKKLIVSDMRDYLRVANAELRKGHVDVELDRFRGIPVGEGAVLTGRVLVVVGQE